MENRTNGKSGLVGELVNIRTICLAADRRTDGGSISGWRKYCLRTGILLDDGGFLKGGEYPVSRKNAKQTDFPGYGFSDGEFIKIYDENYLR